VTVSRLTPLARGGDPDFPGIPELVPFRGSGVSVPLRPDPVRPQYVAWSCISNPLTETTFTP
jgi:hypothetical protein